MFYFTVFQILTHCGFQRKQGKNKSSFFNYGVCVHFNKMTSGCIIKLELREEEKSMIGKKHSCHQIITHSNSYVVIWRLLPRSFFKYCNEFRHYLTIYYKFKYKSISGIMKISAYFTFFYKKFE